MFDNPVAVIVALIGSAGLGGFLKEIVASLSKLRSGVSAKESGRKRDLVSERDYEYDRAESEARNRRRLEEYSAVLRRTLVELGEKASIPEWPKLEVIPDRALIYATPPPEEPDAPKK